MVAGVAGLAGVTSLTFGCKGPGVTGLAYFVDHCVEDLKFALFRGVSWVWVLRPTPKQKGKPGDFHSQE